MKSSIELQIHRFCYIMHYSYEKRKEEAHRSKENHAAKFLSLFILINCFEKTCRT